MSAWTVPEDSLAHAFLTDLEQGRYDQYLVTVQTAVLARVKERSAKQFEERAAKHLRQAPPNAWVEAGRNLWWTADFSAPGVTLNGITYKIHTESNSRDVYVLFETSAEGDTRTLTFRHDTYDHEIVRWIYVAVNSLTRQEEKDMDRRFIRELRRRGITADETFWERFNSSSEYKLQIGKTVGLPWSWSV